MDACCHTVLCVDDEENILGSLKRLLRKEPYRFLAATSGNEGLNLLAENDVHLIISDQRMPDMSGTEFLARVKAQYPDAVRIILTGYTDVDSITEAVNQGHIYKFFLKPWDDQNLRLEIKQALKQYDLVRTNRQLHQRVLEQNEELKRINENLEDLVRERTTALEIHNRALELSNAILEDLPIPIIGVSAEGTIVLINREAQMLTTGNWRIAVGKEISGFFSNGIAERISHVMESGMAEKLLDYSLGDLVCHIDIKPLSGRFRGKGAVVAIRSIDVLQ